MKVRLVVFALIAGLVVVPFAYGAQNQQPSSKKPNSESNDKDEDLLGGEGKGKQVEVEEDEEVEAVKEKSESKAKKKAKEGEGDEDILEEEEVYKLPEVFVPIPRLILLETEEAAETPKPILNISPIKKKKKEEEKVVPAQTKPQPKPQREAKPVKPAKGAPELPIEKIQAEKGKEIPMEETLSELEEKAAPPPKEKGFERTYPKPYTYEYGWPENPSASKRASSVVGREEIELKHPLRVSDLLLEESLVFMNFRSPVVNTLVMRGRSIRDIAIYVDGVHVSTPAFYPFELGVLLDSFDVEMLDQVQVLAGQNDVYLGSDAKAGAVLLSLRQARRNQGELGAEATLRLETASSGASLSANVEGRQGRIDWFAAGSIGSFDNVYYGRSLGIERSTGYDSYSGMLKLVFNFTDTARAKFAIVYNRFEDASLAPFVLLGINSSDKLSKYETILLYLAYEQEKLFEFLPKLRLTVSLFGIDSERVFVPRRESDFEYTDTNELLTMSAELRLGFAYGFDLGASYSRDVVMQSEFKRTDRLEGIPAGELPPYLPDGAGYNVFSVFAAHRYEWLAGFESVLGVRYELHKTDADWATPDAEGNKVDASLEYTTSLISTNAGVSYKAFDLITFVLNLAYGMRAPSLDQVGAFRWYDRSGRLWLSSSGNGNIDLEPEKTLTPEAGIKINLPALELSVFYYYSYVSDLIVAGAHTIDNADTGITTMLIENYGNAYIQGLEADARLVLGNYSLRVTYSYTKGEDEDGARLELVPPHHGGAFLRWMSKSKRWWVEGYVLWAARQDKPVYRTYSTFMFGSQSWSLPPADEVPAWYTLNARAGLRLDNFAVSVGVRNLLDKNYVLYGSGMNMPGRSITARLSAWF